MKRPWILALLGACSLTDSPQLAESEQHVEDGELDTAGHYPGVGKITTQTVNGTFGLCTGTLVAPNKVLTAWHCLEDRAPSAPIYFSPRAEAYVFSAFVDFKVARIEVPTYYADFHTVDYFDADDIAHDVAILVLEKPVPITIARPHPVAGVNGTPVCAFGDPSLGTIVGYASEDGDLPGLRRFGTSPDWEFDTSATGATWENSFFAPGGQTGAIRVGDSGGPLFVGGPPPVGAPAPTVCGVGSGSVYAPIAEVVSVYAATHVGSVHQLLLRELTGTRYDCWAPPNTPGDGDGDQVHDACDRCPMVRDPAQLDTDQDGIGDACDNCPTHYNPDNANHAAFAQLSAAGLDPFGGPPLPTLPGTMDPDPQWATKFPGDVCNPDPLTALSPRPGSSMHTSNSPRVLSQLVHWACPATSSSGRSDVNAAIDNSFLATSMVGGANTVRGNTRILVCDCPAGETDKACFFNRCARNIQSPSANWHVPTLIDRSGAPLSGSAVETTHVARAPNDANPALPIVRPAPEVRELGFAYWDFYHLPAPAVGTHPVGTPLLWSWTRNYGATRPPAASLPSEPWNEERRQSYTRLNLEEHWAASPVDTCREAYLGVLIDRGHRIPNLGDCPMCGVIGMLRVRPGFGHDYAAPRTALRGADQVMTDDLSRLLADDDVAVATAVDSAPAGGALATVYRRSTRDVFGTVAVDAGLLAFTASPVPANNVIPVSLDGVAAMSAGRQEIAFLDTFSYENFDFLALRTVNLRTSEELRFTVLPIGALDGAITGLAYRAQDDAYFFATRSRSKVIVYRLSRGLVVTEVAVFSVAGDRAPSVDLQISPDGLLAITRRGSSDFAAVVLDVDSTTLAVTPVAHVSGQGQLVLGATPTPEGLILERTTSTGPLTVYPLAQQGEPDITYHELTAWDQLFN